VPPSLRLLRSKTVSLYVDGLGFSNVKSLSNRRDIDLKKERCLNLETFIT
jgi:hypothetical protein